MNIKILSALILLCPLLAPAEVVEEIYAVVNGEPITLSEIRNAEKGLMQDLQSRLQPEEVLKAFEEGKAGILQQLIDYKLILSQAKSRGYDVDADLKRQVQDIKKSNNIETDEDLRKALRSSGITYEQFLEHQKAQILQQKFLYEEAFAAVSVNNGQVMEQYRAHADTFTEPARMTLNALFLDKSKHTEQELAALRDLCRSELDGGQSFAEVCQSHSDYRNAENVATVEWGTFNPEELDPALKEAATRLQEGQQSPWVENEQGWYLLEMSKLTPSHVLPFAEVQDKIRESLLQEARKKAYEDLLARLRNESDIQTLKAYP